LKDIVCFSSTRWDFLWQRPQQIMSRLAERNMVLFIDHFMLLGGGGMTGLSRQNNLRKINDNLHLFSPHYMTKYQLVKTLEGIYDRLNITNPVLWVYYPNIAPVLEKIDYSLLCYDCVDDFSHFSWTPASFAAREEKLLRQSDLVFVTAARLKKLKEREGRETYLVPNGADVEHFGKALDDSLSVYDGLKALKKPVIGFIGAIYEWVDLELIGNLCLQRPGWSFVFVGPAGKKAGLGCLSGLKNLYLMGKKDYDVIPQIIKGFDACIIPFKVNSLTESANPIKLYEYLAAGKPVVSTPIPEVIAYKEVVKIASTADEFIKGLEKCMEQDEPGLIEKRLKIARDNSWNNRVEIMEKLIDNKLNN